MINTNAMLQRLCTQWNAQPAIGIDTEFERTRTYYARPGLIQLSDAKNIYLVDPIAISNFTPLAHLLSNQSVDKIFHSGEEDLLLLTQLTGVTPNPFFDTQIAAAFLGIGFSLSYRCLVKGCFGVNLDKKETRSNWQQRPLTEAQKHYAKQDVEWLIPLYQQFTTHLRPTERWGWLAEECQWVNQATSQQKPHRLFRFRNAWQLSRQGLALLSALIEWREALARETDRPRRHIVSDHLLFARASALSLPEISHYTPTPQEVGILQKHRDRLIRIENDIKALPDRELPPPVAKPLSTSNGKRLLNRLKKACAEEAMTLGLAPELLTQRRLLETLIYSMALNTPGSLKNWQRAALRGVRERFQEVNSQELEAWVTEQERQGPV